MVVKKTMKPHLTIELQGFEDLSMMDIILSEFLQVMDTKQVFYSEEHREYCQKSVELAKKISHEMHS